MVLFYAWTDTQLINYINARYNFYKNENADLIVYKLNRISERFLEIVINKRIFNNVYIIEKPYFYKEKPRRYMEYFESLINGYRLRNYFQKELEKAIYRNEYDTLITSAFWSESMNVYRYIRKFNKNISIEIIEEGMANYNGPKDWIYRTAPAYGLKVKVRNVLYYGNLSKKAREAVSKFYLYAPELSWMHAGIETERLPAIEKDTNKLTYNVICEWSKEIDSSMYADCEMIYVEDPPCLKEIADKRFKRIGDIALKWLQKESILLKMHPLQNKKDYDLDKKDLLEEIVVDDNNYPLELKVFSYNIDEKIMVVNQSSALLYIKCMLGKEPYVLMTYRMKPYCDEGLIDKFDFFSEKLKKIYSCQEKIMIPNNIDECEELIKSYIGRKEKNGLYNS